ncbi:MAG TPA: hypothetical protein P5036_02485 [Albidovulum sp.]|uniref:hypothetical protein n=1 Tax=Albidovulum sp. TaxID=1872424 RepID=UPI002C8D9DB5|nr:hypothetical protein [Albidovulum sp.]
MLKKLIEQFSGGTNLPIEVDDIVRAITEMGVQDEIHLFQADTDPAVVRGVFHQYRRPRGLYCEPDWITQIVYTKNIDVAWQRVICCKELVHLFDAHVEQTDTEEEVSELLKKLLGPLSTEDYGLADLMAAKDRIALYQSLPLLFPRASLEEARWAVQSGEKTPEEIADWACIPVQFVRLMLSEHWEHLNGALMEE